MIESTLPYLTFWYNVGAGALVDYEVCQRIILSTSLGSRSLPLLPGWIVWLRAVER